jgi:hypothetical protein
MFINDIIEKSKSKPNNNRSGSYGSPFVKWLIICVIKIISNAREHSGCDV